MTIRIHTHASNAQVVHFPTSYVKDGPARPASVKTERGAAADQSEAREAITAQNKAAARTPIANPENAARIAAMLRSSISSQATAAVAAQANLDPHRVISLLD